MSVTDRGVVEAIECRPAGETAGALELLEGHEVRLGVLPVTRMLPLRQRRMIGPWCFLDRFGPMTFAEGHPMDVAPHPHIGLQTVTWLLDGEIRHDDSPGCNAVTRPGAVSVMTAGRGIAHSERTPDENSHRLDGVQLWVALPDAARGGEPGFATVAQVPVVETAGGRVKVFAGSALGAVSAAPHHSPIVGMEVELPARGAMELPLTAGWEYGAVVLRGDLALERSELELRRLYYLGSRRAGAGFSSRDGARVLIIGGPPFGERILMWWNFVARTAEELAAAREDWVEHRRFPDVTAYRGARLEAPGLAGFRLKSE